MGTKLEPEDALRSYRDHILPSDSPLNGTRAYAFVLDNTYQGPMRLSLTDEHGDDFDIELPKHIEDYLVKVLLDQDEEELNCYDGVLCHISVGTLEITGYRHSIDIDPNMGANLIDYVLMRIKHPLAKVVKDIDKAIEYNQAQRKKVIEKRNKQLELF